MKRRGGQNPIIIIGLHNSLIELHNYIFEAPPISDYTALFELCGSIKLPHRILCHTTFFNQACIVFKSATCP